MKSLFKTEAFQITILDHFNDYWLDEMKKAGVSWKDGKKVSNMFYFYEFENEKDKRKAFKIRNSIYTLKIK